MFYVYILKSRKDRELYFGYTENLVKRLKEHNLGLVRSTKSRIPIYASIMKPMPQKKMQ